MNVYIVHCTDCEGPLYESIEATFERLKETFGIKIKPSQENLIKLRNKELDLQGNEEAVKNFLADKLQQYSSTWEEIDLILDRILSNDFRNSFPDSEGRGWVYNWFCIDHVGFTGKNPRRRQIGHHKIFDYYKKRIDPRDDIQWHFHPLALTRDAHKCGTAYLNSPVIFEILARKIIDKFWFPAAYRPGFQTERPDSNWFLEQWIPFDYGNLAMKNKIMDQPDLADGRFNDWRYSPTEWMPYHPDHDDYQKKGISRRWIAKCLNMYARFCQIEIEDIEEAFNQANSGKPALISFSNHDFRDMEFKIIRIRKLLKKASKKFPHVNFHYCNAIEGFRKYLGIKDDELYSPDFQIEIEKKRHSWVTLKITSRNPIFGPQPYFAIKTQKGEYFWDNMDFHPNNAWSYTFDFNTLYFEDIEKIGIAANTSHGVTEVVVINTSDEIITRKVYNMDGQN